MECTLAIGTPSPSEAAPDRRDETLARLADANAFAAELLVELETAKAQLEEQNRQLETARAEAEESARCKSVFLANMSHELRTPLNAIIGYSELLLEDEAVGAQPRAGEDLERIRTAGLHLLTLISDVLDLSKIEAGGMTLLPESVSVAASLESAAAIARPLMATNRNRFVVGPVPAACWVRADPTRLRQCLLNLLSNAAKFTHDGEVRLDVETRSDVIRFHVRDTGVGIPAERMHLLFQSFVQLPGGDATRGGTGLGLVISQKLARLMQGDVTVHSEPGVGSTFTLTIPVDQAAGRAA